MKNKLLVVAAIAALGAAGTVNAAGDAEAGKAKSAACAACHGQDGNSPAPNFPKLAGQHPGYMVKQLKDFKAGKRKDATMAPMALPLSEQDMEDIAAYFSAQKKQMGAADDTPWEDRRARRIIKNAAEGITACIGCHGPTGAGNPLAGFPALSGQHATYTAKQLKDFRAGTRANDAGQMMRNVTHRLSDADIEALASFIQGLH